MGNKKAKKQRTSSLGLDKKEHTQTRQTLWGHKSDREYMERPWNIFFEYQFNAEFKRRERFIIPAIKARKLMEKIKGYV